MDVFSVLTLFGGLALFLFGMQTMGEALEKRTGSKLKSILERLTSNPLKGVLLGAGVTAIIQSSSATTVMVVGFVNSGIMQLRQAISIIMGANIGTTITAWILSLTGLESGSFIVQMFKPTSLSPILALIGVVLFMFSKLEKRKDTGRILLGFAVLMFGMELMSGAVKPLSQVPEFASILTVFSNPIFGVLTGALVTAIIQSSSASVGILQALSATGSITYASAIPIIMGQNIGTTVTALISSVGTNKNARRAALVHLYFNIIGTLVLLALYYAFNAIFKFSFASLTVDAAGIAIVHSAFNIACTMIMLPMTKLLEKLAYISIKDGNEKTEMLDRRFFATPSIALSQAKRLTLEMAHLSTGSLKNAISLVGSFDPKVVKKVREEEDLLDLYEDRIGTYLIELSSRSLTQEDSHSAAELLHMIGDFERIGDHAVNITETAEELYDKKLEFSHDGKRQLAVMTRAIEDVLDMAVEAFENDDLTLAVRVEPLEQVVDYLKNELKSQHVKRMQRGECTIELGFIFSDLLTNYERVADHASNIAACVIETKHASLSMHKYLSGVKSSDNSDFSRQYEDCLSRYSIENPADGVENPDGIV